LLRRSQGDGEAQRFGCGLRSALLGRKETR
jgi:hypothetical protein